MIEVRLTAIAAFLMCISAGFQVISWIGGAPGGQAFYACVAALYAVLWWERDKKVHEISKLDA